MNFEFFRHLSARAIIDYPRFTSATALPETNSDVKDQMSDEANFLWCALNSLE